MKYIAGILLLIALQSQAQVSTVLDGTGSTGYDTCAWRQISSTQKKTIKQTIFLYSDNTYEVK